MAAIYLLRHGQASFGDADYDVLSEVGKQQSVVLGAELRRRGVNVAAVWSGTLRRQLDTAAACGLSLPVMPDDRWNEYDHMGMLAVGANPGNFQDMLDEALAKWIEDGESVGTTGTWTEFRTRIGAAVTDVFAELPKGGAALVFTSGGVIAAICHQLLGLRTQGFLSLNRTMCNAGITKLVSGRSGVSLVSINEHGHFEGEQRQLLTYR